MSRTRSIVGGVVAACLILSTAVATQNGGILEELTKWKEGVKTMVYLATNPREQILELANGVFSHSSPEWVVSSYPEPGEEIAEGEERWNRIPYYVWSIPSTRRDTLETLLWRFVRGNEDRIQGLYTLFMENVLPEMNLQVIKPDFVFTVNPFSRSAIGGEVWNSRREFEGAEDDVPLGCSVVKLDNSEPTEEELKEGPQPPKDRWGWKCKEVKRMTRAEYFARAMRPWLLEQLKAATPEKMDAAVKYFGEGCDGYGPDDQERERLSTSSDTSSPGA